MVDIDFDALAELPNLLENGDFSAGNDDSTSRIPGWGGFQGGDIFWLDYSGTVMDGPALCLDMTHEAWQEPQSRLFQVIEVQPGHQYALTVLQAVDNPAEQGGSILYSGAVDAPGESEFLPTRTTGSPRPHSSATIMTSDIEEAHLLSAQIRAFTPPHPETTRWWIGEVRVVDLTAAGLDGLPETDETIHEDVDPWSITGPDDADVHAFTRDWWGRLPRHVQDADRVQQPIPVPLLRFLDGIGDQAGRTRDQNRAMWSGEILDPERTADNLLPWLAFLIGFTRDQRDHPPRVLREAILDHLDGGTHQVGTRQQIASTIRPYLNPGARVQVLASASAPHTLIIGVTPDDVPDQNYDRLTRQFRAAGVVPAGHALIVQDIRATWDQWEAAAGTTWEDKQHNLITWQDSDYAGVELQ